MSIDDNRTRPVEDAGAISIESLERDVDRALDVLVFILEAGEHLDKLRLLIPQQPLDVISCN